MSPTPTNPTTSARNRLAALLAHHADVAAAALRADARTGLPEYRSGMDRAVELLDLHAAHLTADEETPAVRELLDSILSFEAEHPAAPEVARQALGTTTGQPVTAPWPPAVVERPDHGLYTLLRRVGLTPEAAQQEIDTYTQTILARQTPAPAVDPATVCICGHPAQQHFEDVCQVCDCGDYLVPEAAREMIAHLRGAALAKQDGRRAATLREGADLIEQALIHSVAPAFSERDEVWDQAVRAAATELRNVADGVAAEAQQPTPAETALCDLMFEDGRQCAKPDGHRPFGSDDPHVPAPAEEPK